MALCVRLGLLLGVRVALRLRLSHRRLSDARRAGGLTGAAACRERARGARALEDLSLSVFTALDFEAVILSTAPLVGGSEAGSASFSSSPSSV